MQVGAPDGHGQYGILDDDGETVLCHECGGRYRALATHLSRTHDLDTATYRARHGLPRTLGLTSATSTALRREIGVRRRDSDPRVLAALDGEGAQRQRAAAWASVQTRAGTAARQSTTKSQTRQQSVDVAARAAGYTDFEVMVGAARTAGRGWAWIARELGMSQTPLRRWAEGQGLSLPRELPASSAERLADLRAHLDAGGTLADAPRPLRRWLSSRRWARQHQRDGRVDRELDLIAPDWDRH